jgi:hypothetical protein
MVVFEESDDSIDFADRPSSRRRDGSDRMRPTEWRFPSSDALKRTDPVHMRFLKWEDILFLLQENIDNSKIYQCADGVPFVESGKARYILYVYINPRPLTEEDEKFVTQYAHIPKYREGVEKGWSILFYNYKNGYVITPGIVDRMEMLKLLPQEALDHDDGLEYCFTDGTFAF